jgi:hypothetical protein
MKRIGKVLVRAGLCCGAIAIALFVFSWITATERFSYLHEFASVGLLVGMGFGVYLGITPALLGGVLWCAGWIVEGFLTPDRTPE